MSRLIRLPTLPMALLHLSMSSCPQDSPAPKLELPFQYTSSRSGLPIEMAHAEVHASSSAVDIPGVKARGCLLRVPTLAKASEHVREAHQLLNLF